MLQACSTPTSPVVQLSRMPGAQSNTRAGKKREELINAVDTLSSHLQTTFTALSAALARRQKRHDTPRHCVENTVALGRAYIAYVLGPSVGAAKARVVFAVDGLEVKEQGTGVEVQQLSTEFRDDKAEAEGAQPSGEFHTEHSTVEDSGSQSGSESEEEPSNTSEDSEEENDDAATPPPPSRSPSPSPPSSPLPNALLNTPPPALPDSVAKSSLSIQPFVDSDTETPVQPSSKLLSENTSPLAMRQRLKPSSPLAEKQTPRSILPASHALSENTSPLPTHQHKPASPLVSKTPARHALAFASLALSENTPPAPRRGLGQRAFGTPLATSSSPASKPALAPAPSQTREAEQQALRAADRLLSRTLANACAEGDGGLSAELGMLLTSTEVLCHGYMLTILILQHRPRRTSSSAPRAASRTPRGSPGRTLRARSTLSCTPSSRTSLCPRRLTLPTTRRRRSSGRRCGRA